jgi:hypothetical protein
MNEPYGFSNSGHVRMKRIGIKNSSLHLVDVCISYKIDALLLLNIIYFTDCLFLHGIWSPLKGIVQTSTDFLSSRLRESNTGLML